MKQIRNNNTLKPPKDWTEAELKEAMKEREKVSGPDVRDMMLREREWFDHYYGNTPVEFDETGKMVQPKPVRRVPTQPVPIRTADGKEIDAAIEEIIARLPQSDGDEGDVRISPIEGGVDLPIHPPKSGLPEQPGIQPVPGMPDMKKPIPGDDNPTHTILPIKEEGEIIKGIQSGLNFLSGKKNNTPLPNVSKTVKLKEDGVIGPKTSFGLKKALVDNGTNKVSEAIALGQFKETVKKAKKQGPQNLAGELGATFKPLLGTQKPPKEGFQPEGLALQDTLNDLGANLKDDGIVGPKTEEAFGQIVKAKDEDEIMDKFGFNLGFDF
ncbi:hypothetical protein [Candidatus Terasakiella magnetica]|nr:hypothetical protein [Candidatus Terasakiella magnetica]